MTAMATRRSSGFTLIELMVTVAIVALLSTIAMPMAELAVKRSKEQDLRYALREIRTAIDAYKKASEDGRIMVPVGESGYPPTLQALVGGVQDARSPDTKPAMIYFLRRIPRDPMDPDTTKPPEDTWGKRDYESPPDAPEEGKDIYDVYSLSQGVGINGIPYRDW
jgi:general secretion pathway protein G